MKEAMAEAETGGAGWRNDDGLRWRPRDRFGVEIGNDLSVPLSGAAADRLRALFRETGLIVAYDQKLDMDQQTALLALFGPILRRIGESGYLSTDNAHSASRSALSFHADAAYTPEPFEALALHAVDVVDGASSTRFVSAERACATMADDLRGRLSAHSAEMMTPLYDALDARACDIRDPAAAMRAERPSIIVNPRTGKSCIGVSEMHTARLNGMAWEESRALLHATFDHLYAPDNMIEHVWRRGDIVIWDNVTFQHARGSLAGAGRRILQRVIVGVQHALP